MSNIRPISDLRNKFNEISKQVNEKGEVVILTKNGYSNMAVMSMEKYESLNADNVINYKISESVTEYQKSGKSYDFDEVMKEIRELLHEEDK